MPDWFKLEQIGSVGYYSTQGSGSNTPATQLVTLLNEAITLLVCEPILL